MSTETEAPVAKPKPKRTAEEKAARKKNKADKQTAKQRKQTVKYTVSQTNGANLHLCEDGWWRTDEDLFAVGEE